MTTDALTPDHSAPSGSCSPSKRSLSSRMAGTLHLRQKSGMGLDSPHLEEGIAAAAVLEELSPAEHKKLADTGEAVRYVRACSGSVQEAVKRLRATFAWREKERPESLTCTVCEQQPRSHFMHVVGHDTVGRPIIYSCMANVTDRKTEHNKLHMLATFQQAIRLMPPGVSQWVWVCDFKGFGLSDVDPSIARIFLHVSAEHYPERLGHFFVVDPPAVFNLLWKCVQPWVDPITSQKITFTKPGLPADKAFAKQHFSSELMAWLRDEMAENRNSRIVKSKVYSYQLLAELARQPPLTNGQPDHSVYGTPSLLQYVQDRPEVLQPPGKPPALKSATA